MVQRRTLRVISLITLALLWKRWLTKNAHLLPPLSKMLSTWIELLVSGQLFQALLVSLQALFLGLSLFRWGSACRWDCSWDDIAGLNRFSISI